MRRRRGARAEGREAGLSGQALNGLQLFGTGLKICAPSERQ